MEPLDYLKLVARRWPLIVGAVVIAVGLAWITTPDQDPNPVPAGTTYQARHMLIREPGASMLSSLETAALLTTTGEVPARVAARPQFSQFANPAVLAAKVSVNANQDTETLAIKASDDDPEVATALADAFAEELVSYLAELADTRRQAATADVFARLESLQTSIAELDQQLAAQGGETSAPLVKAQRDAQVRQYGVTYERLLQLSGQEPGSAGLVTLEAANPVAVTSGGTTLAAPTSRTGRVLGAVVLAVMLGVGIALVVERLRPRVQNKEDTESAFQLPVLVEVPVLPRSSRRHSEVVVATQPSSKAANAFRLLRTSTRFAPLRSLAVTAGRHTTPTHDNGQSSLEPTAEARPRVILVTSAGAEDGKTTTVVNLAAAFAETGKSVLVVDGDLRRSNLQDYLEAPTEPGLSDLLTDEGLQSRPGTVIHSTVLENVSVVPAGSGAGNPAGSGAGNPAELFARHFERVDAVMNLADVIIIDTPPLLAAGEAVELVSLADAVVVVARAGRTAKAAATRASELLARLGAPVVGVVLVGSDAMTSAGSHSYYYDPSPALAGSAGAGNGHAAQRPSPPERATTARVPDPAEVDVAAAAAKALRTGEAPSPAADPPAPALRASRPAGRPRPSPRAGEPLPQAARRAWEWFKGGQ